MEKTSIEKLKFLILENELEKILKKYHYVNYIIREYIRLQKQGYEIENAEGWIVAYHILQDLEKLLYEKVGKHVK